MKRIAIARAPNQSEFCDATDASLILSRRGAVVSAGRFVDARAMAPYSLPGYTSQAEYLFRIPNATVARGGVVITGDVMLNANNGFDCLELVHHQPEWPVNVFSGKATVAVDLVAEITEPCCYLSASSNYSAWILGELPRLELYKNAVAKILLHGKPRPFHLECLDLLGIDRDDIISVDGDFLARDLFWATPTYFHHTPSPHGILFLRRVAERFEAVSRRRIYASRSRLGEAHDRRIRNEAQLERALGDLGIDTIWTETESVESQIKTFKSAIEIVAPFGAALANLVFCQADIRVTIVATKHTPEFARILQTLGVSFRSFPIRGIKVREIGPYSKTHEFILSDNDMAAILDCHSGGVHSPVALS